MNYRMILYFSGVILAIEACLLCLPMAVGAMYGESIMPFLNTIIILALLSIPCIVFKPKETKIYSTEGFVCVCLSWVLLSLFGALPFYLSGAIPSYVDALFETASGFTTTGASILTEIESLPKGILFWRSFTHWVGGMGVLVFMLAILPTGGEAIHLMRAEVPGPTKGKLTPKLRSTTRILYGIYILLTLLMIIALLLCGQGLYESVVDSLATAGTGGFSINNNSIAGYNKPAVEWVIAVFMVLFGVNFNLYYLILIGRARDIFKNEELRVYLCLIVASVAAISVNIYHLYNSLEKTLRLSFFQVASIMSTSGYSTVDYEEWGNLSKTIIVVLTMIGGCAGSTAGGFKISRLIIVFKNIFREIKHMLDPHSVSVIRMDGEVTDEQTVKKAGNYFSLYIVLIILVTLLISIDGFDLTTNLTAALTCVNNVGPGLGKVGPTGSFAEYSVLSKLLLSLTMIVGRLEILPFAVLFSPISRSVRLPKSRRGIGNGRYGR